MFSLDPLTTVLEFRVPCWDLMIQFRLPWTSLHRLTLGRLLTPSCGRIRIHPEPLRHGNLWQPDSSPTWRSPLCRLWSVLLACRAPPWLKRHRYCLVKNFYFSEMISFILPRSSLFLPKMSKNSMKFQSCYVVFLTPTWLYQNCFSMCSHDCRNTLTIQSNMRILNQHAIKINVQKLYWNMNGKSVGR